MGTPQDIDDFNAITTLIFDRLYTHFPERQTLFAHEVLMGMTYIREVEEVTIGEDELEFQELKTLSGARLMDFYKATISWLTAEGFITLDHRSVATAQGLAPLPIYTLSAKTLTALASTPSALDGGVPLGSRLGEVAKEAGSEAGRSAIAELVGLTIGAATRGFASGAG